MSRLGTLYSTRAQMSRPPGVPCSSCSLRLTATLALVVSTTGDVPVTVTVSASVATRIVRSMGTVWPTMTVDVLTDDGLESLKVDLDVVGSGWERREPIHAAGVADAGRGAGNQCRARQS